MENSIFAAGFNEEPLWWEDAAPVQHGDADAPDRFRPGCKALVFNACPMSFFSQIETVHVTGRCLRIWWRAITVREFDLWII
jgi:hypothetical protein